MNNEELAQLLGSVCVSGETLTGAALVMYLENMPPGDKLSMLDDIALLFSPLTTAQESAAEIKVDL